MPCEPSTPAPKGLESSWRVSAALFGNTAAAFPLAGPLYTLAARFRLNDRIWVTNWRFDDGSRAAISFVTPGTGVLWSAAPAIKPAGPASNFPYGFDVLPDSRVTWPFLV